jgi:hypothetical protein
MFRYLVGAVLGAVVLYAVLALWPVSDAGPDFKVWVKQTHIPPNNDPYDVLNVQSREEEPVVLKSIVMNDDPKCINMDLGNYKPDTPVKLGEVFRFGLGIHGFNACEPVKVVISTDRGEATYTFGE